MEPPETSDLEVARKARLAEKRGLQTSSRRAHDLLRSGIRMGLMPRDTLLAEHELVEQLATSRNAVREALQLLATEKLVERSPRTGTRLVGSILELPIDQFLPLVAEGEGGRLEIRVLEMRVVPATPVLAARLEIDEGDPVSMGEQLILVDGQPIAMRCAYLPLNLLQEIVDPMFPESVYSPTDLATTLAGLFGEAAGEGTVENFFEAVPCEPRTSECLGVPVGSPILSRELLVRDKHGRPYLFGYARYRGDRIAVHGSVPITAVDGTL
ncbi:MAG: putative GntR-family transcriptional regulator [Pseudonocardiales bacterium]|nr:putative GntR-family transcriptional regulator [Pseudonocardiales bacterium]